MTSLGNPTRKRGLLNIFLAYESGHHVFKQHQFVLAALKSAHQDQDQKNDDNQADSAAGAVTPVSAMGPSGNCSQQQQHKHDKKNGSKHDSIQFQK